MPSTAIDFHRLLVHFPVALFLAAALFQALAVWRNSVLLQYVAKANLVTGAGIGIFTAPRCQRRTVSPETPSIRAASSWLKPSRSISRSSASRASRSCRRASSSREAVS